MAPRKENLRKKSVFGHFWPPENMFLETADPGSGKLQRREHIPSIWELLFYSSWFYSHLKWPKNEFDIYWSQPHLCNSQQNLNQLSKIVRILNFYFFKWGWALDKFSQIFLDFLRLAMPWIWWFWLEWRKGSSGLQLLETSTTRSMLGKVCQVSKVQKYRQVGEESQV